MDIIAKARQVLKIEIEGIQAISKQLDDTFIQLVEWSCVALQNNGKLVLISGKLKIEDPLLDTDYGVAINCVKLRRVVQVCS